MTCKHCLHFKVCRKFRRVFNPNGVVTRKKCNGLLTASYLIYMVNYAHKLANVFACLNEKGR